MIYSQYNGVLRTGGGVEHFSILIVDDEPEMSGLIARRIRRESDRFSITAVESGKSCLEHLEANLVDCILSDYQMPGMNGMELLNALRERGDGTPFIFITAQGNEELAREAFKGGAYDYFTKDIGFAHFTRIINSVEQAIRHHEAEKEIKEREFWINESQRVARLGSYVLDIPAGRWTSSAILNDIFGIEPDYDKTVAGWLDIVHPDDRDRMERYFAGVLVGRTRFEADYRVVRKNDGEERYVSGLGELIFGQDGEAAKMLGTIQDVTERRRAEESLQLFLDLLNKSNDAILVADPATGRYIFFNDNACGHLGYDRAELLNLRVMDVEARFPDLSAWKAHVDEVRDKGALILEGENRRKDGTSFPVEGSVTHVTSGGKDYIVAVIRDIAKRKQSEEALKQAELRYRIVFDQSPDGILIVDGDGRFMEFNQTAHAQLGYTREEFAGLRIADIDPVEGPEEITRKMDEIFEKGRAEFDVRHRTRAGEVRDVHIINQAMVLSGQDVVHSIWRDVTERNRAEAELEESRSMYKALAENLPGIVYRVFIREDNRMRFYNMASQDITGYTEEELSAGDVCPIDPLILPEDRDRVVSEVERAIAEKRPFTTEYRLRHKDGGVRYMIEQGTPTYGPDGGPLEINGVIFDMTGRRLAEHALRESEDFLHNVFACIQDGISVLDKDMNIIGVNPTMERLYPHKTPLVGRKCHDAYQDKGHACDGCPSMTAMETGRPASAEVTRRGPGGEIAGYLYLYTFPLFDSVTGEVKGVIEYVRDVTEARTLEQQKADFYAMLTHDIKSPLLVITGNAEMLAESNDLDADSTAMVNAIRSSGKKIKELADNFLSVSRMEAGMLVPAFTRTDISQALKEVYGGFTGFFENKGVTFKVAVSGDIPAEMDLDKALLYRAVRNLLQNALNFTPPGGSVVLDAKKDGGFVAVSVSDSGPGIPEGEQGRIFDKYYQSGKAAGIRGTGLGLAIVKAVAEAHGGRVEVVSKPGTGSTFRLILPVR